LFIKGKYGLGVMHYANNMKPFMMGLKVVRIFAKARKVKKTLSEYPSLADYGLFPFSIEE